jgi:outer membrane protein TolC
LINLTLIKHTNKLGLALSSPTKLIPISSLAAGLAVFLGACSFQQYVAKPIDPVANFAKFEQKDPASAAFHQYLLNNGYSAESLPIQQWDIDDLTYCALFFHPSLDVARAQWRAAESAEMIASEKALPTVNGNIAHSDDPDPTKKAFALGLSIDIPIETTNKRDLRIENAKHLSQTAKLEIAQTAWQLRHNIAQSLTEYQFNLQQIQLLSKEETLHQEIVAIYQKRVSLGAASNVELSTANLQLQLIHASLNEKKQNAQLLLAKLASNIGLPLSKVAKMPLQTNTDKQPFNDLQTASLQTTALLNRLDIRITLERYAAAEAKLKLEIAKQYPDLVISPGYAFEFGDNVWSLGLSSLLTLLNKNKLNIAEATLLREVEAAQFDALQTKVMSEASIANAQVTQAKQIFSSQQKLFEQQQTNTQRKLRLFKAGEIDRLELTYVKLENITSEKNVALAHFQLKAALNQLEDTLQKPLTGAGVKNEP